MCGIVGLFRPKGLSGPPMDMMAALSVLHHRGPDGRGHYASQDRSYQAGFNRLAIIDIEKGGQPLRDQASGRVLTGNGEIYNYKELRRQSEIAAYPFKTTGDMVLDKALKELGGKGLFTKELDVSLLNGGRHHRPPST